MCCVVEIGGRLYKLKGAVGVGAGLGSPEQPIH